MKKILAVFLLLAIASACSAQVEHSGLTIPGDGAVQVVRKSGFPAGYVPDYRIVPQIELNDWLQAVMPYTPTDLGLNEYARGDDHGEGDNAFAGAVIISASECVLPPLNSDYIGIYNYVTDTYTRGPAHLKGDGAFGGAVLLDDGRVVLCPQNSNNVGIYDRTSNSYSDGPATGLADSKITSGIMLPSGKVYLTMYDTNWGIYDPVANTLATYTQGVTSNFNIYAALDDKGRAWTGGFLVQRAMYLDYANVTSISLFGELKSYCSGVCIGKDTQHIAWSPYKANATISAQLDTVSGIFQDIPGIAGGDAAGAFYGAIRLANGLIMWVPNQSDYIGLYNPVLNTYTQGPAHGEGASAFSSGVLVPGGKVIMAPRNSDYIGVYKTKDTGMTWNQLAAPWFNKP